MSKVGKLSGRCLCGAVRFRAEPAGEMHACHCDNCRRWSGGVNLSAHCGSSLELVDSAELRWYKSSDWAERGFCAQCGSSLFWRGLQDGSVIVSINAFDDPARFNFADELFIEEKPANYDFANKTHKMTGAEVFAAFAASQENAHG